MDPSPSAEEAAAIAAAVEQFRAETAAPAAEGHGRRIGPWQRAALIEGAGKRISIEDLEGEGGSRWLS